MVAVLVSLCSPSSADITVTPFLERVVRTQSTPVQYEFSTVERADVSSNFQDIIIAGGLDGRVYAINAWTGDTLWTFDSGGPMVDSSSCGVPANPQQEQNQEHDNHHTEPWRTTTIDVDETLDTIANKDERAVIEKRRQSAEMMTASAAVLAELVPSYDGRLYHLSKSQVKELEMTMVDIINANGPVRLVDDGPDGDNLSDIILFGEKKTEIFALDATNGLIQPYYPLSATSSPVTISKDVLFGRSEFATRAVHARNSSSSRCFKIAEYFLQFTDKSRCSFLDKEKSQAAYIPPDILVLPKDPDASEEDEGSTITAYDPWTNKQLWEVEIPHFEVLAVYGISTTRGSTFYQWKVDGPSSHASSKRRELSSIQAAGEEAPVSGSSASARQKLLEKEESEQRIGVKDSGAGLKQLANVVSRTWVSMESQFRLRLLGENYYLEFSTDDVSNLSGSEASSAASSIDDSNIDELFRKQLPRGRKRRIFWEPIVNDGKRGVFITYYHVGAMMVGVTVGCLLIAWGCYVKGLSASIAHSAIKSMDGRQFFMSHVHQLTIERPGEETITISSVIGRPLLMTALGSSNSLPMLENGEQTSSRASSIDVNIDPKTEAELMEKFARMAAIEAASRYSSSKSTMLQLEYDADAADSSVSSALVARPRGSLSTQYSRKSVMTLTSAFDAVDMDLSSELVYLEEKIPASIVEVESISDEERSDAEAKATEEDAVDIDSEADVSVESSEKSEVSSWSSDTGSSSSSDGDNSNGSDSNVEASAKSSDSLTSKSEDQSKPRKGSDASSSDSSHANEAEVLFPFVCQSRFANEFEEISAIGKGGFGQVILAENRLDGRQYAIKRVGLHLKNQTSKTLQKFLREVKILALLDHPNIVRYYQAWLEKVEDSVTGLFGTPSDLDSSLTGVPGRNYSMSNLLAPISEMEFSENQRSQMDFYSDADVLEDDDDGGFEWERDSSVGASEGQAWREEDLVQSNGTRRKPREVVAANRPAKVSAADDDVSVDKCDHWLYIQMQYCAGRNLGDYLALPNRPMELSKLLKIFVQITSALAHVHSCGLIHRDLKPANIFVADTEGDSIKLGDFGLSRYAANVNLNGPATVEEHHQQLTTTVTTTTSSTNIGSGQHMYSSSVWSVSMSNISETEVTAGVGTYLYASPEQVAGKKYNAKTDIYSLGMILFELCHERFTTTMERYIALRNARENEFPVEFRWNQKNPELMAMVSKLLSHDPAARPSADDVVKWGQEFYEMSLAQQAMSAMRSPLNPSRGFGNLQMTSFDLMAPVDAPSTFSFHVEAKTDDCGGGENGRPNHNLLKEICDVIGQVGNDQVEIKKCGLQLQDGVQILEFVLDAPLASDASDGYRYVEIVAAIEALSGVEQVRELGQ